jgi:SPP1 gp7 family putative phage head morphogenesis protein
MQVDIKFVWNLPGETEINNRLTQLNTILGNMSTSENLKRMIQLEIAKLLNIEDYDKYLLSPEDGVDDLNVEFDVKKKEAEVGKIQADTENKERKKEENSKQPRVPGAKPDNTKECSHNHIEEANKDLSEMNLIEFVNLKEAAGFNYTDYIRNILSVLKTDKFENLKAITEKDVADGLLPASEVEKVRSILKDAFRKNKSIAQIEKDMKNYVNLTDRITETRVIPASERYNMIARTETLRVANEGLIKTFKVNDIKRVSWLAALSERTCEICEGLNGQIMTCEEYLIKRNEIHPMCRCTALAVLE